MMRYKVGRKTMSVSKVADTGGGRNRSESYPCTLDNRFECVRIRLADTAITIADVSGVVVLIAYLYRDHLYQWVKGIRGMGR
jgi:hypothetical protein